MACRPAGRRWAGPVLWWPRPPWYGVVLWGATAVSYQRRSRGRGQNDCSPRCRRCPGHRGDLQAAAPIEQQFRALIAEHPDPLAVGLGLATSQVVRLFARDLDGSRAYGEQCLAGTRALGCAGTKARSFEPWHSPPCCRAATSRPRASCWRALRSPWSWETLAGLAIDLDRLGQAAVALGRPERAVILAGAAARLRESVGGGLTVESGRWETEHPRDAARRLLTDTQIETAWARGRAMSLEDAVAYARA